MPTVLVSRGTCWGWRWGCWGGFQGAAHQRGCGELQKSYTGRAVSKAPHIGQPQVCDWAGIETLPVSFPFPMPTFPQVASRGVDVGHS